jgi:flagellar protein FliL
MSDEKKVEQDASGKPAGAEAEVATPAKSAKPAAPAPPAKPRGLPPVLLLASVVVAALALGGAAGSLLIGPRIATMRAAPGSPEAPEEEAPEPDKGHEGKKKEESKAVVYRLDNIIVNPAGSQGTRFLMASVAFELPDSRLEARLRERDFQVRDVIIATLERQSLQMLMAPGARDSVKRQLGLAVQPLTGRRRPVAVYLPQFVIQ